MRTATFLSTLTVGFLALTVSTASAATDDGVSDDPAATCVLAADVDENGTVDIRDYMGVLSAYGTSDATYDTDGDGLVGSRDLTAVLRSYGSSVDDACRGIWLHKNYHLSIQGMPMDLETGEVNFILQAAWRNSIRNMELCWAPSDVINGDICDADAGGNEISITNGQGDDQPWVTETDQLFPNTNRTIHTISMGPDTLAAQELCCQAGIGLGAGAGQIVDQRRFPVGRRLGQAHVARNDRLVDPIAEMRPDIRLDRTA